MCYPTLYYIGDDNSWVFLMVLASYFSFDTFSKEWRLKPKRKKLFRQRLLTLSFAVMLYASLWSSYFYFNATVTDVDGDEIKLSDAVKHFLTSPIWVDLKVCPILFKKFLFSFFCFSYYYKCYVFSGEFRSNVATSTKSRILGYLETDSRIVWSKRWNKCLQSKF